MKIKIFYANNDFEKIEKEINEFIKDKKVIDAKHSISSYVLSDEHYSGGGMDFSVLIMYEEKVEKIRKKRRNSEEGYIDELLQKYGRNK